MKNLRIAARSKPARAVAMTIAGSDPGGGAGLQADLKTFAALGVYGFSVITAVIAQNSARVTRVAPVDAGLVEAQIETLVAERMPDAIKIGALGSAAIAEAVARAILGLRLTAPVVDPVMLSSSGAILLEPAGERVLRTAIIPLARLVTPNIPEAQVLSGIKIDGRAAIRAAARAIRKNGARAVLIKGGHLPEGMADRDEERRVTDLLFDGRRFVEFTAPRIAGGAVHGTGCALSAAIAAWLARGVELETAIARARQFINRSLKNAFVLGAGRRLLDHFAK
ncbi:MAG TPA: bifunctional hydroxymethylpyrimidine kinase/phosphomethylpyrimidine kinase [Candidatus Binataceae bacterium]|nr:bifunctional hydroxymethylpyrimidine kinase/phosphomethylpyrimidine kinase [Candidatus Binataceae bacterium]